MENLAGSYDRIGRREEATRLRGKAADLRARSLGQGPAASIAAMLEVVTAYENAGRWTEARSLRDEIGRRADRELPDKPGPQDQEALLVRAEWQVRQGHWQAAARDGARLIELSPQSIRFLYQAATLLGAKDRAGFEALRRQALAAFENSPYQLDAERASKICWLVPDGEFDRELARKLSNRSLELDGYSHCWALLNKGLCEYRQGEFRTAAEFLEKSLASGLAPEGRASGHAVLAMTRLKLGQQEAARGSLQAAGEILGNAFAQGENSVQQVPAGQWHDWLISRCLFEEAKALLGQAE